MEPSVTDLGGAMTEGKLTDLLPGIARTILPGIVLGQGSRDGAVGANGRRHR